MIERGITQRRRSRQIFLLSLSLAFLLGLTMIAWLALRGLHEPVNPAEVAYTGSAVCADCHEGRHESWDRTYHRTMTQEATAQSVVGAFDGKPLAAFGGLVRPVKTESGVALQYFDAATGAEQAVLPIERTVGSHRYQQYLARDAQSETYYRLHYLWHIEDKRWVHMNAAFLGDDAQGFDTQVTTWNTNCVFCHNTGPQPKVNNLESLRARARAGEDLNVREELRFDTQVAELGIGCEACHGPGATHVQRMGRIDRRVAAKLASGSDSSIVNPSRLPGARANHVCGACHAGRTLPSTEALDQWLADGPTFRPGDDLSSHLTVLSAHTPSPSAQLPDLFRNRFWQDGSPRLTAYEYQGIEGSACAVNDELTCIRCHTMHGGDPAGMLPEANRGDAACVRCHQDIKAKGSEHTGHKAGSAGSECMACHMPRAVYGVMTVHRTHLIAIPDVAKDMAAGKPNACLNCHTTRSPQWASVQTAALRFSPAAASPQRHDGTDPALSDGLASLLAGDPVRQALMAFELGQVDQAPSVEDLLPRIPWLIEALADDRPAVRRFAWKSLSAIETALTSSAYKLNLPIAVIDFDYTGPLDARETIRQRLRTDFAAIDKSAWPHPDPQTGLDRRYVLGELTVSLLREIGARSDKQIDVGE